MCSSLSKPFIFTPIYHFSNHLPLLVKEKKNKRKHHLPLLAAPTAFNRDSSLNSTTILKNGMSVLFKSV
jgi:hypothetical protein